MYYYYFWNNRKIIKSQQQLDVTLNPSIVELTPEQVELYTSQPDLPVWLIKQYNGDYSIVENYLNQSNQQNQISLEDLKEQYLQELDNTSRTTLSKFVDTLSFANAVASSIYASERNLSPVVNNLNVFQTADKFLIIGTKCKQLYTQYKNLIENAISSEDLEMIKRRLVVDYNNINEEDTDLEVSRRNKLREIDAYDTSYDVNGFYLDGNLVWLDRSTRTSLSNTLNCSQIMGRETINIWFSSVFISLPIDLFRQMLAALEIYAADCFNVTAQHKVTVNNLTTIQEIEAFDVTQGYPEKLSFNTQTTNL